MRKAIQKPVRAVARAVQAALAIRYCQTPIVWHREPLRQSMRKLIRSPTANLRRKQLVIKEKVPREILEELVETMTDGDMVGLKRVAGVVQPTATTYACEHYRFESLNGSVTDKLFRNQDFDLMSRHGGAKEPKVPKGPYKRGLGAAMVRLSRADQKRGLLVKEMSMACGNILLNMRVPRRLEGMPTVELLFFVLTMNHKGEIIWPTNFEPRTRAALRNQARALLTKMLADPLYPIDPAMRKALTAGDAATDSVLALPPRWKRGQLTAPEAAQHAL